MSNQQPFIAAAGPRQRRFATSAVALQAIIINQAEEILLLFSRSRKQGWQFVSGALEAGETVLEGTLREVHEELGANIRVRPLGTVHVQTFHYDERVQYMLSINTLLAYQGGEVIPVDDMVGSEFRWWSLTDLDDDTLVFHGSANLWLFNRAVDLYRLWVNQPELPLQPALAV